MFSKAYCPVRCDSLVELAAELRRGRDVVELDLTYVTAASMDELETLRNAFRSRSARFTFGLRGCDSARHKRIIDLLGAELPRVASGLTLTRCGVDAYLLNAVVEPLTLSELHIIKPERGRSSRMETSLKTLELINRMSLEKLTLTLGECLSLSTFAGRISPHPDMTYLDVRMESAVKRGEVGRLLDGFAGGLDDVQIVQLRPVVDAETSLRAVTRLIERCSLTHASIVGVLGDSKKIKPSAWDAFRAAVRSQPNLRSLRLTRNEIRGANEVVREALERDALETLYVQQLEGGVVQDDVVDRISRSKSIRYVGLGKVDANPRLIACILRNPHVRFMPMWINSGDIVERTQGEDIERALALRHSPRVIAVCAILHSRRARDGRFKRVPEDLIRMLYAFL